MNPPLPEQGDRPYQYRFSPRNIGADVLRSLLPAPVNVADRFTGSNIRAGVDRLFGGVRDRMYNDEAAYMRNMLNQDSRAMQPGLMDRLRQTFGRDRPSSNEAQTFGLGQDQGPAEVLRNPAWVDNWIANGTPPIPQRSRMGASTIAQGRAAQEMFGGMRDAANASITSAQARQAMQDMFRDSER